MLPQNSETEAMVPGVSDHNITNITVITMLKKTLNMSNVILMMVRLRV